MSSNGTGWVRFAVIHSHIAHAIEMHCKANPRNNFSQLSDGSYLWERPSDDQGRGVAAGSEVADFIRVVANAVFVFKVSVVAHPNNRAWSWNFRQSVADLVRIIDHGWTANATTEEVHEVAEQSVQSINANIVLNVDGSLTGTWE
jgi:hypothetical protein